MVFPAGKYEAFRIDIGDSEGKTGGVFCFHLFVCGFYLCGSSGRYKDEFRNVLSNEAYLPLQCLNLIIIM